MSDPRASRPSLPGVEERITLPGRAPGALPPLSLTPPPPAAPIAALRIGFAMGWARLFRRPAAIATLLGMALVAVSAVIERRVGSAGAVDRVLAGTFNLVLPLVSFGVVAEASGRSNLRDGVWPAARYGVARRDAAFGVVGAAMAASAGLGAWLALISVLAAQGAGNPPLLHDLFTSMWIAVITAAAYAGWFSLGATFGRRGGGRWVPLVLDFLLGGGTGLAGTLLPRGHAHNLLGIGTPLGLPQGSSSAILMLSALILAMLAAVRCRE